MQKTISLLIALTLLLLPGVLLPGGRPVPPPSLLLPVEDASDGGFDIVLTFSGDMMLASLKNQTAPGNFNDYANKNAPSYFLQNVKPIFEADDLTVVNLENVLTDRELQEREKGQETAYWYRARTANTAILTEASVEAASLSNNHTGDYGPEGFQDTAAAVKAAGLLCGTNDNTFYFEKNGYRVAFICHGLWNERQASDIIARIRKAEENSDFQIVFYHGGAERIHAPEDWKQRACRRLADNGADLVIGSHPHVLQPREVYNGVEIVYSMGNFCYGGNKYPENRTILYQYTLHIGEDGDLASQSSEIIPCYVYTGSAGNNYCPAVIEDEAARQKVLDFMDGKTDSPL